MSIDTATDVVVSTPQPTVSEAVRTPWTEFWRKFRKQKVALFAGGFVALLVLVAVAAPWVVPYDAENFFDYDRLNAPPSLMHSSATVAMRPEPRQASAERGAGWPARSTVNQPEARS